MVVPISKRNAAARSQLQKELPVEFVEVPLEDAVAYLADSLEVQMYIDRRALDDAAISTDEPIDMNLRKIPGTMAFDLVLRQVDLTWGLREGVVMITTPEAAEANLVTRVYSVRDLASQQQAPKGAGAMGPMGGLGAGGTEGFGEGAFGGPAGLGGGEGGGMDGGGGFGMGMHPAGPQDEFGQLATVIQSSCKPDSWQAVGGPGVVVPYRGTFVITQTYLVHQQVEDLLSQLREAAQ